MSRKIPRKFVLEGDDLGEADWAEHIKRKKQQEQQQDKRRRSEIERKKLRLERKKLRMLNRKWWQFWI